MIDTNALAKLAGLSKVRIRQLAHRIPGAVKLSAGWIFPDADAALAFIKSQPPPGWEKGRKRK